MPANLNMADIQQDLMRAFDFRIPGEDTMWEKFARVSLTALGTPTSIGVITLLNVDKTHPKDYIVHHEIDLEPVDGFSYLNVGITYQLIVGNVAQPYRPADKVQSPIDPTIVIADRMQAFDVFQKANEGLRITFTNTGLGVAGYDVYIMGRILRIKN